MLGSSFRKHGLKLTYGFPFLFANELLRLRCGRLLPSFPSLAYFPSLISFPSFPSLPSLAYFTSFLRAEAVWEISLWNLLATQMP